MISLFTLNVHDLAYDVYTCTYVQTLFTAWLTRLGTQLQATLSCDLY